MAKFLRRNISKSGARNVPPKILSASAVSSAVVAANCVISFLRGSKCGLIADVWATCTTKETHNTLMATRIVTVRSVFIMLYNEVLMAWQESQLKYGSLKDK